MSSEHRKHELVALLGNCILAISFMKEGRPELKLAQEAAEQHLAELNRDYPDWKTEFGINLP